VGDAVAVVIGSVVEEMFSSSASLVVFLVLFFANFAIAWIVAVRLTEPTAMFGRLFAGRKS
jgi:hypothetical protein